MTAATPNPTLGLLSQLGVEDHKIRQIAEIMSAFETRAAEAEELDRLRAENEHLKALNRTLLAHSDFLASAVGACPDCWGEDAECPQCGGCGGPGAFVPQRVSFDEIVRPVLDQIRERLAAQRRRAAPAFRPHPETASEPVEKEI